MLNNSPTNPLELKDVILSRLGAPIINVEVTQDQMMECISRAIELFAEFHPDGTNRGYVIVPVTQHILDTKIVTFEFPVYAVETLIRSNRDYFTMGGGATMGWFSDYINGMANGQGGNSQSMLTGGMMFGAGSGLQTYASTMSNLNMMYDQLAPMFDFWFNETSNSAQVNGDYELGELLVFKVWTPTAVSISESIIDPLHVAGNAADAWQNPKATFSSLGTSYNDQSVFDNRWVKDMSTAYSKQMNGIILKKSQGMTLPGGVQVDGQTMYQEATEEIAMLREELMGLDQPLGVIWG